MSVFMTRGSRRRVAGVRCLRIVVMVIAVGVGVVAPTLVSASGSGWLLGAPPDPSGGKGSVFLAVSCTAATACTAVGLYGPSNNARTLAERWNGSSWAIQSSLNPSAYSELDGVACASSTSCVAVGDFVDGTGNVTLAEGWNGTDWTVQPGASLGGGSDGHLTSVSCTSPTACTSVGWYADSSSTVVPLAERWNGTAWTVQPTPAQTGTAEFSGVSCASPTACTAVGQVNATGAEFGDAALAESWNGQGWKPWPTAEPAGVQESDLSGVSCATATTCMSVGSYDHGDSESHGMAERLDGYSATVWADLGGGSYSPMGGVSCTADTSCTAVGTTDGAARQLTFASRFDGRSWTIQPTVDPSDGAGDALGGVSCTSSSTCMAVGGYSRLGSPGMLLAEGGSSWSVAQPQLPSAAVAGGLNGVACPSTTACMAVGGYTNSSGTVLTSSDRLNGTTWVAVSTPNPSGARGSQLNGVACTSASECTAIGTYADSTGRILGLAERWNGQKWTIQATPTPTGGTRSVLQAVSCVTSTRCTAVGSYFNSTGSQVPLAETWNGSSWTVQPAPIPAGAQQGILLGVSCTSANACTAVGDFTSSGGTLQSLAETWSGSGWAVSTTPNPTGATATVLTGVSCTAATACSAVGFSLSGASVTLAMRWKGTSWTLQPTPNPAGANGDALQAVSCISATSCTAVGEFSNGSQSTLAQSWDGTAWTDQATPNPAGAQHGSVLLGVLCTSATRCTAVGNYVDSSGSGQPLAET